MWDFEWSVRSNEVNGNAPSGELLFTDGRNTLARGISRLVTLVEMDNRIVDDASDVLLVADRKRLQELKHIVKAPGE